MKDVQCYELFGGIADKNHAFSFFISYVRNCKSNLVKYVVMLTYADKNSLVNLNWT